MIHLKGFTRLNLSNAMNTQTEQKDQTQTLLAAPALVKTYSCFGATSGMTRAERFGCYGADKSSFTFDNSSSTSGSDSSSTSGSDSSSTYRCFCRLCAPAQHEQPPDSAPVEEKTKPNRQDSNLFAKTLGSGRCRFCSMNHLDIKCPTRAIWASFYEMEIHMACGGVRGGIEQEQKNM